MAITSYKAVVGYYNSAGTPNITTAVTGQLSDGWIPIGAPILTDAYGQCTQMMAKTDANPVIATSAYTVVTAANPQPPDATWDAQGEPLWIDTATYLQAYTKGGAYLQGTVPVSRGGTGATTTLVAAANLRVFAIPNNLSEVTDRSAAWLNIRPNGALPLGGDPVSDYDAATMRWVRNYVDGGGGGGGASMNGVMNYGIGQATPWYSRAFIPSYAVPMDGQLLNRADYPDLWAYVSTVSPIADATWLASSGARGNFSTGNGTTTFRMPDWNGVQAGSTPGLYVRGDQGSQSTVVQMNAAPNITGVFPHTMMTLATTANQTARDGAVESTTSNDSPAPAGVGSRYIQARINASWSHPAYGRDTTDEVRPNSVKVVWIMRAKGSFTATNTLWQVINGDATRPANGVKATSGIVKTQYNVGGVLEAETQLRTDAYMGGTYYSILSVYNKTKGVTKELAFDDDGMLNSDRYRARFGTLMGWAETGVRRGTYGVENQSLGTNYAFNSLFSGGQSVNTGYYTAMHFGLIHNNSDQFAQSAWHVVGDENNGYGCRLAMQPNNGNIYFYQWVPGTTSTSTIQLNAVSDSRQKHDIEPTTVNKAWSNLAALQFVTFVYNNDEQKRTRRGIIAQQAETVDPLYVKTLEIYKDDGTKYEQKQLDTTPMLLDTMHVVQKLIAEIDALKAEVAFLKSGK